MAATGSWNSCCFRMKSGTELRFRIGEHLSFSAASGVGEQMFGSSPFRLHSGVQSGWQHHECLELRSSTSWKQAWSDESVRWVSDRSCQRSRAQIPGSCRVHAGLDSWTMNLIGMDAMILLFVRQDYQYCQDIFCHHQFPEEIDDSTIHLRWNHELNDGQYSLVWVSTQERRSSRRNCRLLCRRRFGILCFIRKQRIEKIQQIL